MDFFVGLWPIIAHYTVALIICGACVAVALLSVELQAIPFVGKLLAPLATKIRMWAIIAAVGSVLGLVGYSLGIKNETARCHAQFAAAQKAAITTARTAHSRARRDAVGGMCDPRDTDCHH